MSSQVLTTNTESAIFARIVKSGERELTPAAAQFLLSLKLTSQDADRIDELSEKISAGSLTGSENQEVDEYLHFLSTVAVWQAKALRILKQAPGSH
jgi:hypothetical protein